MGKLVPAIAATLLLTTTAAFAQDYPTSHKTSKNDDLFLSAGTQDVGISGLVDFYTAESTSINLRGRYGYYFIDDLEVAGMLNWRSSSKQKLASVGGLVEYVFELDTVILPFVGAGISAAYFDTKTDEKKSGGAGILTGEAGGMTFLAENVALSGAFIVDLASQKVYVRHDSTTRVDLRIEFGLRYFF